MSETKQEDTTTTFEQMGLDARILRALGELGFEHPTPIQAEAIPHLLEERDIIGGARTGSGKTAAFGLPLLERVRDGGRDVRALVLAPTRELARQVAGALDELARYLPAEILTVYGGVGYRQQLRGLRSGVSVVVGTPGRVLDHIGSGALDLSDLEVIVFDEADEMLQMGFIEDIERILEATPEGRQVVLFSATMPPDIRRVAERYLDDPIRVQVEDDALTTSHVHQRWLKVNHRQKVDTLARVLAAEPYDAALVFTRTRASCGELAEALVGRGLSADALHGDMSQSARERVMARLRARQIDVVVATDVAARGLDVDHITHVINFDMPNNSEVYVHRIGRTARAGREGWAITFVTSREQRKLRGFQRDLDHKLERMHTPTNAQIAKRQRQRLIEELDGAMDASGSEHAEAWLAEMLEETGWDVHDVAAAALSLLAIERQFDLRRDANEPPPRFDDAREKPEHDEQDYAARNEVELFFPAGRRDGLRPADFVGALCNDAGLPADCIGRIKLGSHKSFVGLARRVAEELIATRGELTVRNTRYPLQLSFGSRDRDDRRGKKGGKKRHRKGKHKKHGKKGKKRS